MPRYDFECSDCDVVFEEKVSLAELDKAVECPLCQSMDTKKSIGIPMIFKKKNSQSSNGISQNATPRRHRSGCPCC